jgi:mannosyltransferase
MAGVARDSSSSEGQSARVVTGEGGVALWTTYARPEDERTPTTWLVLLTALAVALRSIGLDGGLWYDEIRTLVDSVRSPLHQILTVFPGSNQHTFFSVLAHLSVAAFGEHAWSLRLPSVLLGAATVPVLYLFATEFVGRTEALLASLLLTLSYHHIWFSQSARGYAALAFLTVLSSWLLLRGLRRGRTGDFVWYGVASALGVYTHLTMVFLVASHAVLCTLPLGLPGFQKERWRRWRLPAMGFTLAATLTLLLYAPLLLDLNQFFVKRPSPMAVATAKWAANALLAGLQVGLGSVLGVAVGAALFCAGLWSYIRQSRFLAGMFVLPGLITVAADLGLHRPIRPRFLFFLAGFALLIVVRGSLELGRWCGRLGLVRPPKTRPLGIAFVGVMAVLSVVALPFGYRYPKQDFEGAMHFVETEAAVGEPVMLGEPAIYPYHEYFHRPWEGLTSLEQFQKVRGQGRRVWVVYTLNSYIENDTPDLMDSLRRDCAVAGVFRGTVADGDVTVCTAPPLNSRPPNAAGGFAGAAPRPGSGPHAH